jgi:hypothetical protein
VDELQLREASGLTSLSGLDHEILAGSVEGGTMVVRVGRLDHLLRSLVIRLRFALDPAPLSAPSSSVAGAELLFSVRITGPNRPVHVSAPREAVPIASPAT